MSQSQKDLMKKIIDQLSVEDKGIFSPEFDDAKLLRIDISQKNQKWIFHIHTPKVVTFEIFKCFFDALTENYERFGGADIVISTDNEETTQEMIQSYWKFVISHLKEESVLSTQNLMSQVPTLEGDTGFLHCHNEFYSKFFNKTTGSVRSFRVSKAPFSNECE